MCYRNYDKFCIDKFSDDECKNNFRFYRNDIYHLHEVMQLPLEVTCNNGIQVDGIEALSIFLMRFAYPCRFADLVPTFGRPIPQLCMQSCKKATGMRVLPVRKVCKMGSQ